MINLKINKTSLISVISFLGLIQLLAFVFHYPIRIVNALTEESASGFEITISFWRIMFEPAFGPLLFYLRADQPLKEFIILMIWTILGMLVFTLISSLKNNAKHRLRALARGLLHWLMKIPIVIIIWVALLIAIIFFTLPSNTIINNNKDIILVNFHSHSEYSHDGLISQSDLMQWHKRNGFDAFFISEHNHHEKTLAAVQEQMNGQLPSLPLILCAEEYSGSNHLLLLGLQRNFITRNMSDSVVIDSTHANDGVAMVAHWFKDKNRTIQYYIDCGADGFEIANQAKGISYDRRIFHDIVQNCISNDLLMIGASDYHGYGSASFVWNAIKIPGWHQKNYEQKQTSILDILRDHDQSKITVLLYRDRQIFARSKVFFSPIFTFIAYFRSLNFYQILSWIFWVILIYMLAKIINIDNRIRIHPLRLWGIIGLVCGFFAVITGISLLEQATPLIGYNNIYSKYGNLFLWYGAGFASYSILLVIFFRKRLAME
jgi:predicted metal-dependent phosphoesterase TrpH